LFEGVLTDDYRGGLVLCTGEEVVVMVGLLEEVMEGTRRWRRGRRHGDFVS
jgi:hypothetical protein